MDYGEALPRLLYLARRKEQSPALVQWVPYGGLMRAGGVVDRWIGEHPRAVT